MLVAAVVGIVCLCFSILVLSYGSIWMKAMVSGAAIPMIELIGMRLRGIKPGAIVDAYIRLRKAGIDLDEGTAPLQAHHLAGGNAARVVDWLIAGQKVDADVSFERIAALDLARELPGSYFYYYELLITSP